MGVEIEHSLCKIAVRRPDAAWRGPAERRGRSADDERRRRADPERAARGGGGERAQGPVEPAALGAPRLRIAALQHVLAVEMRAVAVARRHRVDDRRMLLIIHTPEGDK